MSHAELIGSSANALVARLRKGEVKPHDCLDALEARISQVENKINALPILCFDRARKHADALMKKPPPSAVCSPACPFRSSDLSWVAGVRPTSGSPIHDHVPDTSDILVEKIEAEGGSSRQVQHAGIRRRPTPSIRIFGATLNPWNTAHLGPPPAAPRPSLAAGEVAGACIRTWAEAAQSRSFCGIVGMRPTPGRVAFNNAPSSTRRSACRGPMARTVEDLALLFDAMSGEGSPRPPVEAVPRNPSCRKFARAGSRSASPSHRPGITPGRSGDRRESPVAAARFADAGVVVEEATPPTFRRAIASACCAPAISPPPWGRCSNSTATSSRPTSSGISSRTGADRRRSRAPKSARC